MSHGNRKFCVRLCFLKLSEPIKFHQQGRLRITLPDMILIYMTVWMGKAYKTSTLHKGLETTKNTESWRQSSCGKSALTDDLVPNGNP